MTPKHSRTYRSNALLISEPPKRMVLLSTIPPNETMPISTVPPPISMTIDPRASKIGAPQPIAAATGRSIRNTSRAPA